MTKRKPILERERKVCQRLKEARETLRFTQEEFADETGIKRQRLASYEEGRAPVRFDIALRICHQFLISEKWLALGTGHPRFLMDLAAEKESAQIPTDLPFGAAFDQFLAPAYERVSKESGFVIRPIQRPGDGAAFHKNYFALLFDFWYKALRENEVGDFLKILSIAGQKMLGVRERTGKLPTIITADDGTGTTFLGLDQKKPLTDVTESAKYDSVKSRIGNLMDRLKRATAERGTKSKLAEYLGVPLANVSQWLSGEREPAGETTLKMLHWVELQERK